MNSKSKPKKYRKSKDSQIYMKMKTAIEYVIHNQNEQPSLEDIAKHTGLSVFHFQRLFTRWTGVTPKNFLQYLTLSRAKSLLINNQDLLSASYDVGLSSPGRLHDLFVKIEAMTPGEYKQQGSGLTISYGTINSPFGSLLLAMTDRGICYLHFINRDIKNQIQEMKQTWARATFIEDYKKIKEISENIFIWSKKENHSNKKHNSKRQTLKIFTVATPFQIKVWEALLKIPMGRVTTYKVIAEYIGNPKACRAVGTAVGANPISYLIPCHRVIQSSGVIGDYRWGKEKKHSILCYELANANEDGIKKNPKDVTK